MRKSIKGLLAISALVVVAACSNNKVQTDPLADDPDFAGIQDRESLFDLFSGGPQDVAINVNRHLWSATLDILSFLPIESADPFSGVIATGWGRVPGSAIPYKATAYISEPALDARSLKLALFRQSGGRAVAVSDETARALEDAILTRARQMRIAEDRR